MHFEPNEILASSSLTITRSRMKLESNKKKQLNGIGDFEEDESRRIERENKRKDFPFITTNKAGLRNQKKKKGIKTLTHIHRHTK